MTMQFPLKQILFSVTGACSLTCRQCCFSAPHLQNASESPLLAVETARQVVDEALPLGLETVRLAGAKSMLHPGYGTLLDLIESRELAAGLETDGSGLTPAIAARIARLPRAEVAIALDCPTAAQHDALHEQPGAFDAAVQSARMLADCGLPAQIVFAVTRANVHQLPEMIQQAERLGAESVRITTTAPQPASLNGNGKRRPADLTVEELIAVGRRVERQFAAATPLRLLFDQPPVFRGLHPQARIVGQGRCDILNGLGVLAGGEYSLCCGGAQIPALLLGRAGADRLAELWTGASLLRELRAGLPEKLEGVCERCIMKSACLGNCPVENYLRMGSFWGPHWFCDTAERAGLFPAGRLIENTW